VEAVIRLDWFARSTLDQGRGDLGEQEAGLHSLGDAWADTTTAHGRLMLTPRRVSARANPDLQRRRVARAKASGKGLGRKPKLTPHQQREAIRRCDRGEPLSDIARGYDAHPSAIS
jgi:DNA invertase Pin-like site-specific DNA recombinase